jgi:ubiquinone/menaquinone biosynthesis C-methylase UbiE
MIFLDVGCGPGRIASYVAPKVKSYYGIDIHPELISIAKEHYKDYSNVTFLKSNGHNIDVFESDFFDYVHERLLFIHIKKEIITEYLLDCCRVLKKKGFLYVPDLPRFDYWVNGFTRDEISSLLLKNFSVVRIGEKSNTYQLLCVK